MRTKFFGRITVIMLLTVSVFFRFYDFPNRNGWSGDTGRDFLAGYLISHSNNHTLTGHFNSGIGYFYPSYYYYFISLLTHVSDDAVVISGIITLLHAFSVLLIYRICTLLFSRRVCICVSLLWATSSYLVNMSLIPLSAYSGFLLFMLALLFFIQYVQKGGLPFLVTSAFVLMLSTTVFYAGLLFIPIVLFFLYLKHQHAFLHGFTFSCVCILSFLVLYSPLIKQGGIKPLLKIRSDQIATVKTSTDSNYFISTAVSFIDSVFAGKGALAISLYSLAIVYFVYRKKSLSFVWIFLTIYFYHVFLYTLSSSPLPHYLCLTTPFFFLSIGTLLENSKGHGALGETIFLILFVSSLGLINGNVPQTLISNRKEINYLTFKNLAASLRSKYPNENFTVSDTVSPLYWESRALWYFFRDRQVFNLSSQDSQVQLLEREHLIHICMQTPLDSHPCNTLAIINRWTMIDSININGNVFYLFIPFNKQSGAAKQPG